MTQKKSKKLPDFYQQRTNELLNSGYPITVRDVDFSEPKTKSIQWHEHDELEFIYIQKGQAYITCGEDTILASKGGIVFINQNVRHFITPAGHDVCSIQAVIMHPSFILGLGQLELEKKYINPVTRNNSFMYLHVIPADHEYNNYLSCIREIISLQETKPDCHELLTKSIIFRLWILLYHSQRLNPDQQTVTYTSTQDEQRVKQAINFIQQQYMENLTLEDIAGSIMVSKSECCRCFRRVMNVTPFEYLMKYRILESTKRMMKKPNESISEIACAVGFNNTSYYNKIFKKIMDCTPTQYRQSIHYVPVNTKLRL